MIGRPHIKIVAAMKVSQGISHDHAALHEHFCCICSSEHRTKVHIEQMLRHSQLANVLENRAGGTRHNTRHCLHRNMILKKIKQVIF